MLNLLNKNYLKNNYLTDYLFVFLCRILVIHCFLNTESAKVPPINDENLWNESEEFDIRSNKEIPKQLESDAHNIKQETTVSKRSYYQCITCSATFTKADYLKDHETVHKAGKFIKRFFIKVVLLDNWKKK